VKLTSSNRALLDINGGGSAQYAQFDFRWDTGVAPGSVAPEFIVNFKIMPNVDKLNIEIFSGGTRGIQLFINSDGSVQARDDATFRTLTGLTIVAGTDYKFAFIITDNAYHIRVNGTKYDNAGSDYLNDNDWTGAVSTIRWKEWGSNTFEVYIDDIIFRQTSVGMQWDTFIFQDDDTNEPNGFEVMEQDDGSVLLSVGNRVYRVSGSDYSVWTAGNVISAINIFADIGSGTAYVAGRASRTIQITTDYGATWASAALTGLSATSYFQLLFVISSTLYAVTFDIVDEDYDVYSYTGGVGGTWTLEATYTLPVGVSMDSIHGFVISDLFYFFVEDDLGTIDFVKYDDTAGTITKISDLSASYSIGNLYFNTVRNVNTVFVSVENSVAVTTPLLRSLDLGATWSELRNTANGLIFVRDDFVSDKVYARDFSASLTNTRAHVLDTNLDHFIQIFDFNGTYDYIGGITKSSVAFVVEVGIGTDVYKIEGNASIIKSCELEGFGNERARDARWIIDPTNKNFFTVGDVVEFLDGFNTLAFKGKVTDNRFVRGSGQVITAQPLKVELLETPKDIVRSFTASATDTILTAIIDTMDFLFQDGGIDANGDFTITYTINIKTPIKDYIKLARELERAGFYVEPSGEVHMMAHDQLDKTGFRWRDDTFKQIQLQSFSLEDLRVTRSEVIGAYHRGTDDNIEARKDYVGDAGKEAIEGVVRISLSRPQLTNHTEVNQLAINRFNIYGTTIAFIKLVPIVNQGFIQPGKTIDFSWAEDNVVVPRGDYYIARWKYNLKFDRYSEFWLTDSIITLAEFAKVKQTIKRDNQIVNTYHEGENETTGDGTVVVQNPVARLRAGASVWRIPEPTDGEGPDFSIGDLTDDTNWNDIDFSSIVPAGAREVLLCVKFKSPFVSDNVNFRKKGQSYNVQISSIYTILANKFDARNILVGIDDNRKAQIKVDRSPSSWTNIDIVVLDWKL